MAEETVAEETVAEEEVEVAQAVAEVEGRTITLQNLKMEAILEDIEERLEVKITSQVKNHKRAIKVEDQKVEETIVVEENQMVEEEIIDVEIDYSSSIIFSLIFEKIPLSSIISLAPGRTDKISSVINPVFL